MGKRGKKKNASGKSTPAPQTSPDASPRAEETASTVLPSPESITPQETSPNMKSQKSGGVSPLKSEHSIGTVGSDIPMEHSAVGLSGSYSPQLRNMKSTVLVEGAIKLLEVGSDGKPFLVESGLEYIQKLNKPLYCIVLVGDGRSGKSFLGCQILDSQVFEHAPTAEPVTEGIDIYAKSLNDGYLLLFDCEGGNNAMSPSHQIVNILGMIAASKILFVVASSASKSAFDQLEGDIAMRELIATGDIAHDQDLIFCVNQTRITYDSSHFDKMLDGRDLITNVYGPKNREFITLGDSESPKFIDQIQKLFDAVLKKTEPRKILGLPAKGPQLAEVIKSSFDQFQSTGKVDMPSMVRVVIYNKFLLPLILDLAEDYSKSLPTDYIDPDEVKGFDPFNTKLKNNPCTKFEESVAHVNKAHNNLIEEAREKLKKDLEKEFINFQHNNELKGLKMEKELNTKVEEGITAYKKTLPKEYTATEIKFVESEIIKAYLGKTLEAVPSNYARFSNGAIEKFIILLKQEWNNYKCLQESLGIKMEEFLRSINKNLIQEFKKSLPTEYKAKIEAFDTRNKVQESFIKETSHVASSYAKFLKVANSVLIEDLNKTWIEYGKQNEGFGIKMRDSLRTFIKDIIRDFVGSLPDPNTYVEDVDRFNTIKDQVGLFVKETSNLESDYVTIKAEISTELSTSLEEIWEAFIQRNEGLLIAMENNLLKICDQLVTGCEEDYPTEYVGNVEDHAFHKTDTIKLFDEGVKNLSPEFKNLVSTYRQENLIKRIEESWMNFVRRNDQLAESTRLHLQTLISQLVGEFSKNLPIDDNFIEDIKPYDARIDCTTAFTNDTGNIKKIPGFAELLLQGHKDLKNGLDDVWYKFSKNQENILLTAQNSLKDILTDTLQIFKQGLPKEHVKEPELFDTRDQYRDVVMENIAKFNTFPKLTKETTVKFTLELEEGWANFLETNEYRLRQQQMVPDWLRPLITCCSKI